jgi:hypothetical protein
LVVDVGLDAVLARRDRQRPELVVQVLKAGILGLGEQVRGGDVRAGQGRAGRRRPDGEREQAGERGAAENGYSSSRRRRYSSFWRFSPRATMTA